MRTPVSLFPTRRAWMLAGALSAAMALGGCAHPGGMGGQTDATQVLKDFRDGWNRRDAKAITAAMGPDAIFTSPYTGQSLNRDQYQRYLQDLFQAVPDFTVTKSEGGMIDPATAAEEWMVTGTWTQPWTSGPLAGVTPTGKPFSLPGVNIIRLKGGKIASIAQYFDQLSLLTQIGVIQVK